MKKLIIFVLFLYGMSSLKANSTHKLVLNSLEDFFRFENVDQVTSYFGAENVFTESSYFGDPNLGGKSYLVSQVNFGTPKSILLIWNSAGNQLCEIKTNVYFFDFDTKKLKFIPNRWKTGQGIYAGMNLSRLVTINWLSMTVIVRNEPGDITYGNLVIQSGWIKNEIKVPFSVQKLVYIYTLDLKRIHDFFPVIPSGTLKSNNNIIKKWNPMLQMISIYREGLRPEQE
jgi:hypothetical protein